MAAKIRSNDEVIVIAGKCKGMTGKVKSVLTKDHKSYKVIVEGVNLVTRHTKPNPHIQEEGGLVKKEAPIAISNVAIYNPSSKKADKVGFRFENGKKVRFYKSNNEIIAQA